MMKNFRCVCVYFIADTNCAVQAKLERNAHETSLSDESLSDSEEEDEDGVLAGDIAGEFMSVLSRIATRDPTLKQDKTKYFRMCLLRLYSCSLSRKT